MYILLFSCTFNWVAWFWEVLSAHCSSNVHTPQRPKIPPLLWCWIVDAIFYSTAGPHFLLEQYLHSLLGTETCCIRVNVCIPGEKLLPKTLCYPEAQMSVRRRKGCTGVTFYVQNHAARQNQHQAENPKPQIKCLTHFTILSLPPSNKRYMQLWEEYF